MMKQKILPWIVALSALLVSGSAAFYSVSGLGKMFAGASVQVMILAGSLEFAKLVKNYQDKEKKLHSILDKYRVNKNREFFELELTEIKKLFITA